MCRGVEGKQKRCLRSLLIAEKAEREFAAALQIAAAAVAAAATNVACNKIQEGK